MNTQDIEKKEKSVVLVGLMGAGKSSVGRLLATKLGLPFVDSDGEVETAAGCSIEDIFEIYGEAAFRDVEARVIRRLLDPPVKVLASGGGAFMNEGTRAAIGTAAISVWLKADLDTLDRRTRRRQAGRPLLKDGDARAKLKELIDVRYPVYAEADITVECIEETPDATAEKILAALEKLGVPDDTGSAKSK